MKDIIDTTLLGILVCPEDKSKLKLADEALIASLNSKISKKLLKTRSGTVVDSTFQSGLIRADGKYLYPIRDGIPVMLVEEAIVL